MEGNSNVQEKRWAKRFAINATIRLRTLRSRNIVFTPNRNEIEVDVINISKGGMAFRTSEMLPINSYYDAKVVLWTKETFDAVVEIVRMENENMGEPITYGCKFIGITQADQFKIDVYDIVTEGNPEK